MRTQAEVRQLAPSHTHLVDLNTGVKRQTAFEDVHVCVCVCVVRLCMYMPVYVCTYVYVCVCICICICTPDITFPFPPQERASFPTDLRSLGATAKK